MIEFRFRVLRFIVDVLFVMAMFFAFMCGIHYGTRLLGLYFWFVKLLLGIVGMGIGIMLSKWVKGTALFMLKHGSIYAQCNPECKSVMKAFSGVLGHFKETISINVFNKLIRECLTQVSDEILKASEESKTAGILKMFNDSKIAKASKSVVVRAFDYVDECILGYCYKNADEFGMVKCSIRAFVIFVKNSPAIFGKVLTLISLEIVGRIIYWAVFILFCWSHVNFSITTLPTTTLNILLCYCIGKLISFILEDAVFEPLMVHGIIEVFLKYEWVEDMNKMSQELGASIPAFEKLRSYCKGGNTDVTDGDEHTGNEQSSKGTGVDTDRE